MWQQLHNQKCRRLKILYNHSPGTNTIPWRGVPLGKAATATKMMRSDEYIMNTGWCRFLGKLIKSKWCHALSNPNL